jgi:hypothetical protein
MFDIELGSFNQKRSFDTLEKQKLGKYVYALRDPRDNKVFYIGQGENDRIFDHFKEAEKCLINKSNSSSKVIRILDIWNNDEDVDWFIVAHGLNNDSIDYVESSSIDLLSLSQNGSTLNDNLGPKSSILTQDDLNLLQAKPINPSVQMARVFIFPIQKALADGIGPYDATRMLWNVKQKYQELPAYAVGLKNGISIGGYSISRWKNHNDKQEFEGVEYQDLINKNWTSIINKVKGYWQRGNYLIVEFDGNCSYKIIRGGGRNNQWNRLEV